MSLLSCRSALLCSDVHLSDDAPALTDVFLAWLDQHCLHADQRPQWLLILGDLFDVWIGDDHMLDAGTDDIGMRVANSLSAISQAGVRIGLMHGNRDFLLAHGFARAADAEVLADPTLLIIENGPRIAITHGDALCTDDIAYQRFREQVRESSWQRAFLARPLVERAQTAQQMRAESNLEKSAKSMAIMDVNTAAAMACVQAMNADMLLHGHTHRPGCTPLADGRLRWVLPDWHSDAAGKIERGGGLWADASGVRVVR